MQILNATTNCIVTFQQYLRVIVYFKNIIKLDNSRVI